MKTKEVTMTGKELQRLRNRMQLSQEAFAKKLGTRAAHVSKWENGRSGISRLYLDLIKKMAGEYGLQANQQ